jgi:hypothetical protein
MRRTRAATCGLRAAAAHPAMEFRILNSLERLCDVTDAAACILAGPQRGRIEPASTTITAGGAEQVARKRCSSLEHYPLCQCGQAEQAVLQRRRE